MERATTNSQRAEANLALSEFNIAAEILDAGLRAKIAEARAIDGHRGVFAIKAQALGELRRAAADAVDSTRKQFLASLEVEDFENFMAALTREAAIDETVHRTGILAIHGGNFATVAEKNWSEQHSGRNNLAREIIADIFEKLRPLLVASRASDEKAASRAGLDPASSPRTRALESLVGSAGIKLQHVSFEGALSLVNELFPE